MKKFFIILFVLMFFLCGCQVREINDVSFVVAIGVDEAENNDYLVSFLTAIPDAISSSEKDSEKVLLNSYTTHNVISASDSLSDALNKKTDFSHCRLIAFSNNVASKGLEQFKKTLLNEKEFRPDTLTVITNCSPKDFFQSHTEKIKINPSEYFELMFSSKYAPTSISHTIKDFFANKDMVMPTIDLNNKRGGGVLKNNTLVTTLSPDQIVLYKLLKGDLSHSYIDFLNNDIVISASPEKKTDIKVKRSKIPEIYITLYLNGEIISEETDISYKKAINGLSYECEKLINSMAKQYNCDFLSLKKRFRPLFLTIQNYENYINSPDYKRANYYVKIIYSDIKTGERIFKV
jgi:Ger(x)C family germination protein